MREWCRKKNRESRKIIYYFFLQYRPILVIKVSVNLKGTEC